MDDIRKIIAENLIALRKKNNITQSEFGKKLNYSDNTVSRWERGEICPSIETLQELTEIYDITIDDLITKGGIENKESKKIRESKTISSILASALLMVSFVWFAAVILYSYLKHYAGIDEWTIFIWAIPASTAILMLMARRWKNKIFYFVCFSVFAWGCLAGIFLEFIDYQLYLIFVLGIPLELSAVVYAFIKPMSKEKEN